MHDRAPKNAADAIRGRMLYVGGLDRRQERGDSIAMQKAHATVADALEFVVGNKMSRMFVVAVGVEPK